MPVIISDAIYENGVLRPLTPLALPEHARVRLAVDDLAREAKDDRADWLAESEQRLTAIWDNPGDEVFNDLLAS